MKHREALIDTTQWGHSGLRWVPLVSLGEGINIPYPVVVEPRWFGRMYLKRHRVLGIRPVSERRMQVNDP